MKKEKNDQVSRQLSAISNIFWASSPMNILMVLNNCMLEKGALQMALENRSVVIDYLMAVSLQDHEIISQFVKLQWGAWKGWAWPVWCLEAAPLAAETFWAVSVFLSWNRLCFSSTLFYEMGQAISTEARAMNNVGQAGLTFFTPNINIYRYSTHYGVGKMCYNNYSL